MCIGTPLASSFLSFLHLSLQWLYLKIPASVPTMAIFVNEPAMLMQPLLLLAFKLVLYPILTFPKISFIHLVLTCPWMYLHHMTRLSACVTPNYCFYGSCNHVHHNSRIPPCFCTHPISRMYYSSINDLESSIKPLLHISVISEHSIGVRQLLMFCNINFLCLTDKIVWCPYTRCLCLRWQLFQSLYSLNKALITHSLGAFANLWKVTVSFVMSVCVRPCFHLST